MRNFARWDDNGESNDRVKDDQDDPGDHRRTSYDVKYGQSEGEDQIGAHDRIRYHKEPVHRCTDIGNEANDGSLNLIFADNVKY